MARPLGSGVIPPEQRFWEKVLFIPFHPCWEWTAAKDPGGYGRFGVRGSKTILSHRFSYELKFGAIPKGKELDHLCRNHSCVNPDHLEAVSHKENIMRGRAPSALHAKKTHCPYGHEYSENNIRLYRGSRFCRACEVRKRRSRKAAAL